MPKLLNIIELGNPILREKAKIVINIEDIDIQELIDDLINTVYEVNGVGISAPQVSESLQIFIMAPSPNPRYPEAPELEPEVIINPNIISMSEETENDWEGCLSIPGIRGQVPRSKSIIVKYSDRYGEEKEVHYSDFIARIFQHEYDHLNGIVFLDRIENNRDIITDREYAKLFEKE